MSPAITKLTTANYLVLSCLENGNWETVSTLSEDSRLPYYKDTTIRDSVNKLKALKFVEVRGPSTTRQWHLREYKITESGSLFLLTYIQILNAVI